MRFVRVTAYGPPDRVFAGPTRAAGGDAKAKGAEHVMLAFQVVMGRIRGVREFVYEVK